MSDNIDVDSSATDREYQTITSASVGPLYSSGTKVDKDIVDEAIVDDSFRDNTRTLRQLIEDDPEMSQMLANMPR